MPRTVSIHTMLEQCEGLIGTDDVTEWENDFLISICNEVEHHRGTSALSDRQVSVIERIWKKHFA